VRESAVSPLSDVRTKPDAVTFSVDSCSTACDVSLSSASFIANQRLNHAYVARRISYAYPCCTVVA